MGCGSSSSAPTTTSAEPAASEEIAARTEGADDAGERLVRLEASMVAPPQGSHCGGGPDHHVACPSTSIRVVVFQRDGEWVAARVQGSEEETTTALAEQAATPFPAERVAQIVRVVAGVEMMPSVAPYAQCPHLVVDTSLRHFEASGCVEGRGLRAPEAPEPSGNRYEAAYRLLHLLPPPPIGGHPVEGPLYPM